MNWNKALSNTEYWFLAIFLLAYLLFFVRTYRLSKALGSTPRAILLKFFLRTGYIGLIITAGLGPLIETNISKSNVLSNGESQEVYFLLDVSQSMATTDLIPSRLEYFKLMLLDQLNTKQYCRLGLIIFSDDADVHSPLTLDYEAFKLFLQSVSTTLLDDNNPHKNFDKAINLATQKLQKGANVNKNIIILTDNAEPIALSENILRQIKKSDIQIFWLNIGKENPLVDNSIITPNIYYEVENKKNTLADVFQEITQTPLLQSNTGQYQHIAFRSDKYYVLLGIALILIIIDLIITIRIFKV